MWLKRKEEEVEDLKTKGISRQTTIKHTISREIRFKRPLYASSLFKQYVFLDECL